MVVPSLTSVLPYAILFCVTLLLVGLVIPILMRLAPSIGLVDKPDDRRKLHTKTIPLIGGIAIFFGVSICCLIALIFFSGHFLQEQTLGVQKWWQLGGLLAAAIGIVIVGTLDDRFGIRGRQKLFAQILIAFVLIGTGSWISSLELFGTKFDYRDAWTAKASALAQHQHRQIENDAADKTETIEDQLESGTITIDHANEQRTQAVTTAKELKSTVISELILNRILAVGGVLITLLWIVGAINSVNLIDGADGLAGTTSFIVSAALAIVAFYTGDFAEATIALCLSAGILGFLIFNFPPAKIFLGDAGSMLIGLVLASLALQSFLKEAMIYICIAPLAIMFIPILDTATAFTRRIATGRSIYSTDRGHLHHILMKHGMTNRGMVLFVAGLTTVTALGGVLTITTANPMFAIIGVATVAVFLIATRIFGFAELRLICGRLYRFGRSLLFSSRTKTAPHSLIVQLQGSKEWHKLWEAITEFGERHHFAGIKLNLNLPWLHESFHAEWRNPIESERDEKWETSVPLAANDRIYGRLDVSGSVTKESIYLVLMLLADLLEHMEPALQNLANDNGEGIEIPELKSRIDQAVFSQETTSEVAISQSETTANLAYQQTFFDGYDDLDDESGVSDHGLTVAPK